MAPSPQPKPGDSSETKTDERVTFLKQLKDAQSLGLRMRDGVTFSAEDKVIAVLGGTGAGKSSFIQKCTYNDTEPVVGHDLRSETKYSLPYVCTIGQEKVILIDTPGFHDDDMEDVDVVRDFIAWLVTAYQAGFKLSGILLMLDATQPRLGKSGFKMFEDLLALTGDDAVELVTLVATKWQKMDKEDRQAAETRLNDLVKLSPAWKEMVALRADRVRHSDNTSDSARGIIETIVNRNMQKTLRIQREVVDEKKEFKDTLIGQTVGLTLAEQRKEFELKIAKQRAEMEKSIEENNKRTELMHKNDIAAMEAELKVVNTNLEQVQKDHKTVNEERDAKYKKELVKLQRMVENYQKEQTDLEKKMAAQQKRYEEADAKSKREHEAAIVRSQREMQQMVVAIQNAQQRRENMTLLAGMAGMALGEIGGAMFGGGFGGYGN